MTILKSLSAVVGEIVTDILKESLYKRQLTLISFYYAHFGAYRVCVAFRRASPDVTLYKAYGLVSPARNPLIQTLAAIKTSKPECFRTS
jgi:hypothetical protein